MAHLLVTLLGAGPRERVRWRREADHPEHETCYAPAATAVLVGGFSDAVVLLTEEARARHWGACRAELAEAGVGSRAVSIPRGATEDEIWAIVGCVADAVGGADEVTADVTHAFRHLPFVVFGSLAYLAALGNVAVRGVYYGAYEARRDGVAPLLDLGPLLALGEWAHAARSLRETGNTRWLEGLFNREAAALVRHGEPVPALGALKARVGELGRVLPAGLPLESGLAARHALQVVAALREEPRVRSVARPVLDLLERTLDELAPDGQRGGKSGIVLDPSELARQLRLARRYLEWGHTHTALLLLREWIVNRCLLAEGGGQLWLEYERARLPMERALAALAERHRQAAATGTAPAVARLWPAIAKRRNSFAHCGFQSEDVPDARAKTRKALEECEATLGDDACWQTVPPGSRGRVLATPLGLSPGVLYTALRRLQPEEVLVIASAESAPLVDEACRHAGWDPGRVRALLVKDPHVCFEEVPRLLEESRPMLLEARGVLVNVAGGTTAMQYLVERVAGEAARLGIPTQLYACIDRRSRTEQEREPYVLGECLPLAGDNPPGREAAGDVLESAADG
jgi:hypothetical protein